MARLAADIKFEPMPEWQQQERKAQFDVAWSRLRRNCQRVGLDAATVEEVEEMLLIRFFRVKDKISNPYGLMRGWVWQEVSNVLLGTDPLLEFWYPSLQRYCNDIRRACDSAELRPDQQVLVKQELLSELVDERRLISNLRDWVTARLGPAIERVRQGRLRAGLAPTRTHGSVGLATIPAPCSADAPDYATELAEKIDRVQAAVRSLPDRWQRTAISLYYFDQFPTRQAAEMMGVPPATLKCHLHYGLHALRQRLASDRPE